MTAQTTVIEIDIDQIQANPWQPRQSMDPTGIRRLADSIKREGLKQYPGVRPVRPGLYEQRWGHRRLAAWRLLRSEDAAWPQTIPAVVEDVDDRRMILDALTENIEREDVDVIEETRAMARAIDEIDDLTQNDLAELLKTSPGQVSNRLRLLKLPDSALQLVADGRLAWTAARELLCLVASDHSHEDEIADALEALPSHKGNWTGKDVRDAIAEVCAKKPSRWRPLEDVGGDMYSWYSYYASGKNPPVFDIAAFSEAQPVHVHKLPRRGDSGHYVWTCAVAEWRAAQQKAKEDLKLEAPPDPRREAWANRMAADQVARRLGLGREKFSFENALSEDELEALGSRGRFVTKAARTKLISGTGYGSPPKYFNKNECFSSCVRGAVYAPMYDGGTNYELRCGNAGCYTTKRKAGLERFRVKEAKRAKWTDSARRKLADEVRPLIEANPEFARGLLTILTERVVDGSPTRPLGYSEGGSEAAYHAPAALRLAIALGMPEDDVEAAAAKTQAIWYAVKARELISELEDPVPAAIEALAIALDDYGFRPD